MAYSSATTLRASLLGAAAIEVDGSIKRALTQLCSCAVSGHSGSKYNPVEHVWTSMVTMNKLMV